jgi:uncharacterized protein YjbJ (UPF0337 family)
LRSSEQRLPPAPGDPDERRWEQVRRELRFWWTCLTDDDVLKVAGRRDTLLALLNEKYGYTPEQAGQELETALRGKPRK